MKKIFTFFAFVIFTISFSQCNYKTSNQNGVTVKQFNPMPIGGDSNKQIALSISNINGDNNLMLTIRFKERSDIRKNVKFNLSDGTSLTLTAQRIGDDFIGGSPISHLIFTLDENTESKFRNNDISSIVLNGANKINAKMYKDYVSNNLKCFN